MIVCTYLKSSHGTHTWILLCADRFGTGSLRRHSQTTRAGRHDRTGSTQGPKPTGNPNGHGWRADDDGRPPTKRTPAEEKRVPYTRRQSVRSACDNKYE